MSFNGGSSWWCRRSPGDAGRRGAKEPTERERGPGGEVRRRRPADPAVAGGRSGGARSRAGALGQRVHRLPRLAGARLGDRPEHHPHEDGQLRPLRADTPGSVLGPFLKAGHPTQSGKPSASFTDDEIVGPGPLPAPARERHDARRRRVHGRATSWSATRRPARRTSTATGGCATCHNATDAQPGRHRRPGFRAPVDIQQRMLFPSRRRAAAAGAARPPAAPVPNAITVTVTPAVRAGALRRARRAERFLRDPSARRRHDARRPHGPAAKVVTTNPLQAHIDLLDRITDKQIHDLVAYLETLK